MSNEFKAGDFTSGKMGEIFKECFLRDVAVINHKQFGKAYMIPESIVRTMVLNILEKRNHFKEYAKGWESKEAKFQDFLKLDEGEQMHVIQDYYSDHFGSWFEVMTAL